MPTFDENHWLRYIQFTTSPERAFQRLSTLPEQANLAGIISRHISELGILHVDLLKIHISTQEYALLL